MKKKDMLDELDAFFLPRPSSRDLRGKQSVRATFRLTARAIDAISVVAFPRGIKQKSLFEHLIEDDQSLSQIARQVQEQAYRPENRVQKTFVLSRRTLGLLQKACEQFDAPRDALVEYSIQRLMPVIEEERKKHHLRKEILKDVSSHVRKGEVLLKEVRQTLGEDDPVYQSLWQAIHSGRESEAAIAAYVEKGKIIEEF